MGWTDPARLNLGGNVKDAAAMAELVLILARGDVGGTLTYLNLRWVLSKCWDMRLGRSLINSPPFIIGQSGYALA